jgi:hypothetical protein
MRNLVRIRSFSTPADAELAKAFLESQNIRAELRGDALLSTADIFAQAIGGVDLLVRERDARRARRMMALYQRSTSASNSARAESLDERVKRAWRSALFGILLLPLVANVYSMVILSGVRFGDLSSKSRLRYVVTWTLDIALIGAETWGLVLLLT